MTVAYETRDKPVSAATGGGVLRISVVLCVALALAFVAGLFRFASLVTNVPADSYSGSNADGIVVLTGDALRIRDAVGLLAEQRGRRLLISGVNPATTASDLRRQLGSQGRLFDCCIDLGYAAQNTLGNAVETGRWSQRHGFTSLIVVTSNYHMPRSLMELGRVMPDTALLPFAVRSGSQDLTRWWAGQRTIQLMLGEYVKYLLAAVYIRLGTATLDEAAQARAEARN